MKKLLKSALAIQLAVSVSPLPNALNTFTFAQDVNDDDYSDTGRVFTINGKAPLIDDSIDEKETSQKSVSKNDDEDDNDDNEDTSVEETEEEPSVYDEEEEDIEYEENEFEKMEEEMKKQISSSFSGNSGFGVNNVIESLVREKAMNELGNDSTTVLGVDVDEIGDIRVDKDINISSYRWATFYKESKTEEVDTSDSDGNYKGFSKEKVNAWKEFESAIKKINNDKFPDEKDYKYPTSTPTQNFTLWTDKPGYYDVYGDPLIDTIKLKAVVDVTYSANLQVMVEKPNDSQGYGEGINGGPGAGSFGSLYGSNLADQCSDLQDTYLKASEKTEENARSNLEDRGCSIPKKRKGFDENRPYTSHFVDTTQSALDGVNPGIGGFNEQGYVVQDGKVYKVVTTNKLFKTDTTYKELNANDPIAQDFLEKSNKKGTSIYRNGNKIDEKQDSGTHLEPELTSITGITDTIVLAECEIHNVYGSQLERVGAIAVGMPNNAWHMDEDEFWDEEPEYYEQSGNILKVQNNTSLPFGFCPKIDGDIIGGTTNFKNTTVQKKNLVHGYNEIKEEDLLFYNEEDPDSSKALEQNKSTGKFITPKIDPALDENNKDSKYVGRVPLISFAIKEMDDTQKEKETIKKYTSLTKQDETDQLEEDNEKKKKEQKQKESGQSSEE